MEIIYLFIAFFIKHFLADYPLQTKYMLRKSMLVGWKLPLTVHSLVHAGFTYIILITAVAIGAFQISLLTILSLILLEFVLHFAIDWWKAQKCRYSASETKFWVALGADQLFHYLTYALIIALVI